MHVLRRCAPVLTGIILLAATTTAFANSGGATVTTPTTTGTTPSTPNVVQHKVQVRASLQAPAFVHAGQRTVLHGTVRPAKTAVNVHVQTTRNGKWRSFHTVQNVRGSWRLSVRIGMGLHRYRVVVTARHKTVQRTVLSAATGNELTAAVPVVHRTVVRKGISKARQVHSARAALASRYDEYGGPLACSNGTLGYDQIGVANKSLPCGTKVTITYHGRTVVAKVIDRGPYVGNREFDLAGATARAIGFNGVGTIWVSY